MYFVPHKGRLYRWAVNVKPIYRYSITFGCAGLLAGGWYFLASPWLESSIQYERAAITQLEQKRMEMIRSEHVIQDRVAQTDFFENKIREMEHPKSEDQFTFMFDAARNAGIEINSFTQEKEKRKEWRTASYKQLAATGTFDQCTRFLGAVKKSSHLIQCKQLSLNRTEGNKYALQCQLQFIML